MLSKMTVRLVSAAMFILAVGVSFQNCSPQLLKNNSLGLSDSSSKSQNRAFDFLKGAKLNSSLRYFGFFADGMEHEGSGNYINETAEVANVHFISADSLQGLGSKIRLAASRNSQVIILAEGYLFDWQTLQLQKNYKSNLASLKKYLSENNLLGSVQGFYIVDEPYFKNSVAQVKLSEQEVFNNLKTASTEILSLFGQQNLLTSEAVPTLDVYAKSGHWLGFPAEINWIAVNCYLAFGGTCDTPAKYEGYVSAIRSTFQSNQRLFLTLDNYSNKNSNAVTENMLIERTKFQVQLANRYDAVALVSFIYQGASDRSGVMDLPAVRSFVFEVASSVTGKGLSASAPPPPIVEQPALPQPGPHFSRGPGDTGVTPPSIPFQVKVSNSSTDFINSNNIVCNTGKLYLRFTGNFQENQKGCVALAGSGACNLVDANAFRKFTDNEYLNSTTIQTEAPAANFPAGNYEVSTQAVFTLPNGGISKVGSFTIKSCDVATNPPPIEPTNPNCTNLEPECEGADSVRRNTCGEVIGRWKMAPICTHVQCEGRDYVRRDSDNKIVEVWKNAPLCEPERD